MRKIIVDGNSVYEIDYEAIEEKNKKRKNTNEWMKKENDKKNRNRKGSHF